MRFRNNVVLNPAQLGARIRLAREKLGISQEELAIRVSRDQRAISEYENGKRKLAAADIPEFAQALHVNVLFFYEDIIELDDFDQAMLAELNRLNSPEAKQAAIQLVRVLSEFLQSQSPE